MVREYSSTKFATRGSPTDYLVHLNMLKRARSSVVFFFFKYIYYLLTCFTYFSFSYFSQL